MTIFYDENNTVILEEPVHYRRLFKVGQELVINSVNYIVSRCNVNTTGDVVVFLKQIDNLIKEKSEDF